jgi:hypothetical protein
MTRWMLPALLLIVSCTPTPAPAPAAAASPITSDELRADLSIIAADSFRGRETGTGYDIRTASFIARRLASLGVAPAGDSGYFQRVPLTSVGISSRSSVKVVSNGRESTLSIGPDVIPITTIGAGPMNPRLVADAEMVFAAYGIVDPALRRDDFRGLDVAGKAVVIVNDAPSGSDSATVARYSGQGGIQARLQRVMSARPAAVILVLNGPDAEEFYGQAASSLIRTMTLRDTSALISNEERMLPMIVLARVRPGTPLFPAEWPTSESSRPMPGKRFVASVALDRQHVTSYNVLGLVRGTTMPGTYVAYGAHLDHVGVGPAVDGDSIYNGADDDGSGTVALLALARQYAQGPKPRRSVLLVWHTGEEKGLFGSQWFTEHPTVPVDSIIAQVNADMVGRNSPDSIFVVGPSAAPNNQGAALGALVDVLVQPGVGFAYPPGAHLLSQ